MAPKEPLTKVVQEAHYISMGNKTPVSPWNGVVSGTSAAILANILVYPLDVYDMSAASVWTMF